MMSPIELDLSSLEKALDELIDAMKYFNSDLASKDSALRRHLRAGTIQAFEFTYELSIKFIRRYLELTESSREIISMMSFPTLIRTANEKHLLEGDIVVWKNYRDKRNITSHTYDENQALEVMTIIPAFIKDCELLLKELKHRIQ